MYNLTKLAKARRMPRGDRESRDLLKNRQRYDRERDRERDREMNTGSQELDEGVIEVQVIPQDDNWGETATSITETATSIVTLSEEDLSETGKVRRRFSFPLSRYCKLVVLLLLALMSVVSPIMFVVLPVVILKLPLCGTQCDGLFISFTVKELILLVGIWALFWRTPRVTMPRVFLLRTAVMGLLFAVIVCYWLFYCLRILFSKDEKLNFVEILQFAMTLLDLLLFIHYLAVVLLWVRQAESEFTIKVVRSTDGVSKSYNVGRLSIQRTAAFVLEMYYKEFPEFNPYLMQVPARAVTKHFSNLKFYDLDGNAMNDSKGVNARTKAIITASSQRKREQGRNDRFYEEAEFERKLKRRRARLISVTEEAFGHIKRVQFERGPCCPMDPEETAQSLFPSFARPLQKYLRTIRQHHRYSMDQIIKHLAHCLTFDMSPKAFLERYIAEQPCIEFSNNRGDQSWSLVCEEQVTKYLSSSTVFQLKTEELSLVVTVNRLPRFIISEDIFDFESNKFVMRLNSETSV